MRAPMAARALFPLLFVLYCVAAGTLLLMLPWSPVWERQIVAVPSAALQAAALGPWARGAVSGFGLLHLVIGAHDLDAWLVGRQRGPGGQRP